MASPRSGDGVGDAFYASVRAAPRRWIAMREEMAYINVDGTLAVAGRSYDLETGKMRSAPITGAPNTDGLYWGTKYVGTTWAAGYWDVTVVDTATRTATVNYLNWP